MVTVVSGQLVVTFAVLCPAVPLEIVGWVAGRSFYYRERHGAWRIFDDAYGPLQEELPLAEGLADDFHLMAAIGRVMGVFEQQVAPYGVDLG